MTYDDILRNFISLALTEDAYKRNTGEIFNAKEKLQSMIDNSSPPKRYFTMTSIPKVGINPQSKYNTPIGVYCYPATKHCIQQLISNSLPFVSDAEHVTFLEATDIDHMMTVGEFNEAYMFPYSKVIAIVEKEIAKLNSDLTTDDALNGKNKHAAGNSDAILFGALYLLSLKSGGPAKWTSLLLQAGVTSVYDAGYGIIHPHEPQQAVFLSPKAYRVLVSFKTSDIRKKHTQNDHELLKRNAITSKNILLGLKEIENADEKRNVLDFIKKAPRGLLMKFLLGPGSEKNRNLVYKVIWELDSDLDSLLAKVSPSEFDNVPAFTISAILSTAQGYMTDEGLRSLFYWLMTSDLESAKFVLSENVTSRLLSRMFHAFPNIEKLGNAIKEHAELFGSYAPLDVRLTLKRLGISTF